MNKKINNQLGDRLFGDMSSPAHAYCLGLVCSSGRMKGGVLELRLRGDGQPLRALLESGGDAGKVLAEIGKRRVRVFAPLGEQAEAYLGGRPGERVNLRFPDLQGRMLSAFLRGLLDSSGRISPPTSGALVVQFERPKGAFRDEMISSLGMTPSFADERGFGFCGPAALDVLGLLYDEFPLGALNWSAVSQSAPPLCRKKHLSRYLKWCQRVAGIAGEFVPSALRFVLTEPDAVLPHKQRVTDSGYDLTLIAERKRMSQVVLYGTGVIAEPPLGWYLDVVPRSSIIRSGYILANSVGVIDRAYRGEIMVPLIKVDPSAPELELPARVAQLVPRPIVHFPVEATGEVSSTERGTKGFGSSG